MALINCPDCGKEVSDSAKNCIHCGCVLKQNLVKCPECGNEAPEGTKTCAKCGFAFRSEDTAQKVVVVNKRKLFTRKKLFMVGLILFFIVSAVFLLVHFISKDHPILNASNTEMLNLTRDAYMSGFPIGGKIFFTISNIFRYISVALSIVLLARSALRKKWVTLIYFVVNILSLPYLLFGDILFTDLFFLIFTGPMFPLILPALALQFVALFIKDEE
ncbi:MAG: hypothetical protein IJ447_08225 [Clostridia bacterium]|nr:hypothetical protein [Clostridia bacterium]